MAEAPLPITPYLFCEDVGEALAWLARAFGFSERPGETMRGDDGIAIHAAMDVYGGRIMLGRPGVDYRNPKHLGASTSLLYVYVDDLDRHCETARAAGAEILEAPNDTFYGDRRYDCADPEGQRWTFAMKLRDMTPDDWNPTKDDLAGHG